jgi:hypothetical protein
MKTRNITYIFSNDIDEDKQKEIKLKIPQWLEDDESYLKIGNIDLNIEFKWNDRLDVKLNGTIKNKNNEVIKNFSCDEFFKSFEYPID